MGEAKRVLCFAERSFEDLPADFKFEGSTVADANFPFVNFEFSGLVALEDPPKEGVVDAVQTVFRSGAVPVMVTGDHPATARAIAQRIGILRAADTEDDDEIAKSYRVVTGAELEKQMPANDAFDPVTC